MVQVDNSNTFVACLHCQDSSKKPINAFGRSWETFGRNESGGFVTQVLFPNKKKSHYTSHYKKVVIQMIQYCNDRTVQV